MTKLASLAAAVAGALRSRGVAELAAMVTAEAGIAVFKIAFGVWVGESDERDLAEVLRGTLADLKVAVAENNSSVR